MSFVSVAVGVVGEGIAANMLAGAMMGAKMGFSQLPPEWVDGLRYKSWLMDLGEKLTENVWVRYQESQSKHQ